MGNGGLVWILLAIRLFVLGMDSSFFYSCSWSGGIPEAKITMIVAAGERALSLQSTAPYFRQTIILIAPCASAEIRCPIGTKILHGRTAMNFE
jgi:hypothetical protein